MVMILVAISIVMIAKFNAFDVSVGKGILPFDAIGFLQLNPIEGNVYNDYSYGGLMIFYTQIPVFIDGRIDVYSSETILDYYSFFYVEEVERLIGKYDIRWFFIPSNSDLSFYLENGPGWKRIYKDYAASIFVKE